MTTPFDADLGTYQGRIARAGAPEGSYVYELGHALPGVVRSFADGDEHTVTQTGSLAGKTLFRVTVDIRPPAEVPVGMSWTFSLTIGAQTLEIPIGPGRTRRRADLAMNVVALAGGGDDTATFALSVAGASSTTYAAEMPSVQLDAVLLDATTATPQLILRDPEPGDTDVPAATTLAFSVTDPAGGASAPEVTDVYVNGALVVDEGVAQGGWAIADSSPDAYTTHYILTPPEDFGSEELVTVRALAASTTGTLDQTWSFTTVDLLAPTLVSVLGFSRREIRVQFDEAMLQQAAEGANDALNPANYVLTLSAGAPAIVPAITSVESSAGDVVILQLDEEMTPSATYLLTIPNVADEDGNVVANPGLQGLFTGYVCPAPPGRRMDLVTLFKRMPVAVQSEDRAGTGDLERFLACLQEPTGQILSDIDEWTDILDVDLAREPFVDTMLADLGNPFEEFSASFSLAEKRKLATLLAPISKQKGTNVGIINAIRILLGIEVTIEVPGLDGVWDLGVSELGVDTTLGTGDDYSLYGFYVVSPVELTVEQRSRIRRVVAYMRRAETHLLGITEPTPAPIDPDDWELGLSELGVGTLLH